MNPYQARRLANRIHKDRARRIETLLVRLAADGSLQPYEDKYRAERELADALATVLHENFNDKGVYRWIEGTVCADVVVALARHKAAWSDPVPEGTPNVTPFVWGQTHKVLSQSYVWCDVHCAVHEAKEDVYEDNEDCVEANWRSVFVTSTDPNEDF